MNRVIMLRRVNNDNQYNMIFTTIQFTIFSKSVGRSAYSTIILKCDIRLHIYGQSSSIVRVAMNGVTIDMVNEIWLCLISSASPLLDQSKHRLFPNNSTSLHMEWMTGCVYTTYMWTKMWLRWSAGISRNKI